MSSRLSVCRHEQLSVVARAKQLLITRRVRAADVFVVNFDPQVYSSVLLELELVVSTIGVIHLF